MRNAIIGETRGVLRSWRLVMLLAILMTLSFAVCYWGWTRLAQAQEGGDDPAPQQELRVISLNPPGEF
jgi:hypothetical protein